MWDYRYLKRLDFRTIPLILALMVISLLTISSMTSDEEGARFLSCYTKSQIQWFILGWVAYIFCVGLDYHYLRSWSWILYGGILILLIGLFFTSSIQNVHRWYKIPILGREFQPSEYAKLAVVITLSSFFENRFRSISNWKTAFQALLIVFIPFVLIFKQPDLGTASVLYPITLVMFYIAGIHKQVIRVMTVLGLCCLIFVGLMFTGILSHESSRSYALKILKEYQYERLNPHTYHQKVSQTAIGLGGIWGSGWNKSEFSGRDWLPAAHTDSIFAAYAEEFGLWGIFLILLFFFGLIYFSFQVTAKAKDTFGRLLSAGVACYLAVHVILNIGMMCGYLPITGVPLILVSYGGSSAVSTMMALGILQSVYSRRFMF